MPYAVCDYGLPDVPSEIEVLGFRLSLPEAFAMVMAASAASCRFARDAAGVMELHVEAPSPRQDLPCDYLREDFFQSPDPDDEAARAQIMRRAGEQVWHGFSIVEHANSVPTPAALKAAIDAATDRRARELKLDAA
jgi:hypothetical protein